MRIAVIGCGSGGLASALFLNGAGHDVTLLDQFERPKPLGSGLLLQPSGQAVLAQLGLLQAIEARSAPVTRLFGINVANGKRALDMDYHHIGPGAHALGIHRASLFDVLFDAVRKAGIKLATGHEFLGAEVSDIGVLPKFNPITDDEMFDLLVDASGAHGPLASGKTVELPFAALWTTVDIPHSTTIANAALDQRYLSSCKMAGIMPVGINPETRNPGAALFWSIKRGEYPALKNRGIAEWRKDYLQLWPEAGAFVEQVRSFDALTLAIYRHRTGRPVTQRRVFHIGDSWHCTSPQLGQGANMALIDAAAIAAAIGHGNQIDEIGRRYSHMRADHVQLYQLLSRVFTPLYQSDSRTLSVVRDSIIHHCARWPLVRQLIAHVVSGNFGKF
jgi:2-polyprenyl-6-methoxyphenol hydroxylase-like FAD-dependent oxidoreductase